MLAELGIPDLLKNAPMTGQELASGIKAHQEYLESLLRLAVRMGLVNVTETSPSSKLDSMLDSATAPQKTYHLTDISAALCEDHPNSVKYMVQMTGDNFGAGAYLAQGIKQGKAPYTLYSGGVTYWQHMTKVPELHARFNR